MEQLLHLNFRDNRRVWNHLLYPMLRPFGLNIGALDGNFREMVSSVLGTLILMYLASSIKHTPRSLFSFLMRWIYREIKIKIRETSRDLYTRENSPDFSPTCNIYTAAETYLSSLALATNSNPRCTGLLRASTDSGSDSVILSVDDSQPITDTFFSKGGKHIIIKWSFHGGKVSEGKGNSPSGALVTKKYFLLRFNARKVTVEVLKEYLNHVITTSNNIMSQNRQLKLYTNKRNRTSGYMGGLKMWDVVLFKHPASFETFAMDPVRKKKIMEDLDTFTRCQEYYARIGKAWKRGYLLYGPPGTGKSTMIACMANYLKYDVFDLELTAVSDNTQLRQIMVNLPSKAIIIIEDIDCSLDLTGARKPSKREGGQEETKKKNTVYDTEDSKVTLSGLLNCIDGLWSTCGGERLIVFTSNHFDKLDPALIRNGRMDVHVELSYCEFEAFKILAKNYLEIDEHPLYKRVEELLKEVAITPADVAEKLLPKNLAAKNKAEECLEELINKMEKLRVDAYSKSEEREVAAAFAAI